MTRALVIDIERISGIVDGVWQRKQQGYLRTSQFIVKPRTICFSWKWLGEEDIHFIAEWEGDDPFGAHHEGLYEVYPGHRAMVEKARDLLDEADFVIGWNSKKFDMKHLREHIFTYRMDPPSPHMDVDLLLTSRSQFGFIDHTMRAVSETLGGESKMEAYGVWDKLRFSKGQELADARAAMEEYNKQDVKVTEERYYDFRAWIPRLNICDPPDDGDDIVQDSCRRCQSTDIIWKGTRRNASYRYRRFKCKKCKGWGTSTKSFGKAETASV